VAVNTLIAGATGGFFAFVVRYFQYETTSLVALSRGVVSGLVAVSAATDDMKPWTAFIYGLLAALLYSVLAKVVPKVHIDDPVEVVPVYLVIIISIIRDQDFWVFSFQHFSTLKLVYSMDLEPNS